MAKKLLKKGNNVYICANNILRRFTIDRTTPTQAVTGCGKRMRIELTDNGSTIAVGRQQQHHIGYSLFYLETEELKDRYTRQESLKTIHLRLKTPERITTETLTQIQNLLENGCKD